MMELTRTKFTDSAGYEIPLPNYSEPYTDLGPVSPEYRTYDALKQPNNKSLKRVCGVLHKRCICALTVSVILTVIIALSGAVAYLVVNTQASFRCYSCGIGRCVINSNGDPRCICPENTFGENCDNVLRESFQVSRCPVDWNDHGSYGCYKVFSQPAEKKTWIKARKFCHSMESNLASIINRSEQENIIPKILTGNGSFWIGLSSITGSFTWSDGSQTGYVNWSPGEPNNYLGNEHCVHLDDLLLWNDNNCHMSLGFICKMSKTNACGNSGDWLLYNSKCYMFSNSSVTRTDAAEACKRFGGSLIKVDSKEKHNFIVSQVSKYLPNDFWTGSNDIKYKGSNKPLSMCPKYSSKYGNWDGTDCSGFNRYICSFTPG